MNQDETIKLAEEAAESAFDAFSVTDAEGNVDQDAFIPSADVGFDFIRNMKWESTEDEEATKNVWEEISGINMQLFRAAYDAKITGLKTHSVPEE